MIRVRIKSPSLLQHFCRRCILSHDIHVQHLCFLVYYFYYY